MTTGSLIPSNAPPTLSGLPDELNGPTTMVGHIGQVLHRKSLCEIAFELAYVGGAVLVLLWSFLSLQVMAQLNNLNYTPTLVLIGLTVAWCVASRQFMRLFVKGLTRHWPMAVLTTMVLCGTAYTLVLGKDSETFLRRGLGMLTFFLVWASAMAIGLERALSVVTRYWGIMWLVMAGVVAWGFATHEHKAHVIMFVFVPLPLYFALRHRDPKFWLPALAIGAFGVLGMKNTTLICAGISIYVLFAFRNPEVRNGHRSPFSVQSLVLVAVVSCIAYLGQTFLASTVENFSNGNTDFRKYNYLKLWNMFLASPLYGDGFVGTPNLYFDLFGIDESVGTQNLPSHSDFLDVLAHGGLVGMGCYVAFLVMLTRMFLRSCRERVSNELYAVRVTLFASCLGAFAAHLFNPVWTIPSSGFMFWTCFALFAAAIDPQRETLFHAQAISSREITTPYEYT